MLTGIWYLQVTQIRNFAQEINTYPLKSKTEEDAQKEGKKFYESLRQNGCERPATYDPVLVYEYATALDI